MTLSSPVSGKSFTIGYDLGTVGTWVRILIGVIASSALLLVDLSDVSGAFLAQIGGWLLGILAIYTAVYALLAPRVLPKVNPWVSTVLFYGPVLVLPYVDALPDAFRVALSLYVTVSIAVVVFVRYGGCEVVGIPALIVRDRYVVYCPWNTVDLVDKAIQDSEWSNPLLRSRAFKVTAVVLAVAVFAVGANVLGDAFPAVWVILAAVLILLVGGGIVAHRLLSKDSAN